MSCACRGKSAFNWQACSCPSIFGTDPTYTKGAATGKTMSQLASEGVERFEDKHGRSLGTIYDISEAANKQAAQRQYQRNKNRKARG